MIKTCIIAGYIAHKIWWKRKHRVRSIQRGTADWNRLVIGGEH